MFVASHTCLCSCHRRRTEEAVPLKLRHRHLSSLSTPKGRKDHFFGLISICIALEFAIGDVTELARVSGVVSL